MKFNFTCNLEVKISHQGVVDHISRVAKSNLLATLREFNLFPAPGNTGSGVEPRINDVLGPAMEDVSTFWTFNVYMWYWRVVRRLLNVNLRTVSTNSFESLAKHRIQGLLWSEINVHTSNSTCEYRFHTLNWVITIGCIIEIKWIQFRQIWNSLEHRHGTASSYWETDRGQIEITTKNFFAGSLHEVTSNASDSCH